MCDAAGAVCSLLFGHMPKQQRAQHCTQHPSRQAPASKHNRSSIEAQRCTQHCCTPYLEHCAINFAPCMVTVPLVDSLDSLLKYIVADPT